MTKMIDIENRTTPPDRYYSAIYTVDRSATDRTDKYVFLFEKGYQTYRTLLFKHFTNKIVDLDKFARVKPREFLFIMKNIHIFRNYPYKNWPGLMKRLPKMLTLT